MGAVTVVITARPKFIRFRTDEEVVAVMKRYEPISLLLQ
jgi:hypothetical protein